MLFGGKFIVVSSAVEHIFLSFWAIHCSVSYPWLTPKHLQNVFRVNLRNQSIS